MVLNRNPANYFAEVEQIAFAPCKFHVCIMSADSILSDYFTFSLQAHLIPGIEASPDKMLQGRIFSYADTQRHRLGANYLQLPVNCPFKVHSYQRDGPMCLTDNQLGAPK